MPESSAWSTGENAQRQRGFSATCKSASHCRALAVWATAYAVFGLVATMVEATRAADAVVLSATFRSGPTGHTMTWLVLWAVTTLAAVATAAAAGVGATLLRNTAVLIEPAGKPDGVDDYR